MNRRDALKTLAAVTAGGAAPSAGAVVAAKTVYRVKCQWMHWSEVQSFGLGGPSGYRVIQWVTPTWQKLYWTPEFTKQVQDEIARGPIQ